MWYHHRWNFVIDAFVIAPFMYTGHNILVATFIFPVRSSKMFTGMRVRKCRTELRSSTNGGRSNTSSCCDFRFSGLGEKNGFGRRGVRDNCEAILSDLRSANNGMGIQFCQLGDTQDMVEWSITKTQYQWAYTGIHVF